MGRSRSKVIGIKLTKSERILRCKNKTILPKSKKCLNNKISLIVKRKVKKANGVIDPLKLIEISMTKLPLKNDQMDEVEIRHCRLKDLSQPQQNECFSLVESNVKNQYEAAGWGWNIDEKRNELFHPDLSRYLVGFVNKRIVGFVHYRFDIEVGNAVLYCYEIHVVEAMRGQGLGRHLMNILTEIARSTGMKKLMLTVLKSNARAIKFYESQKFSIDRDDPQFSGFDVCYNLYSLSTENNKRTRLSAKNC